MPHTMSRILEESRRRQLDRRTYLAGKVIEAGIVPTHLIKQEVWAGAVAERVQAVLAALDKPQEPHA